MIWKESGRMEKAFLRKNYNYDGMALMVMLDAENRFLSLQYKEIQLLFLYKGGAKYANNPFKRRFTQQLQ